MSTEPSVSANHATGIFLDGDTNDPSASLINNNDLDSAQAITAPARVLGFVSQGGTNRFEDRFAFEGDTFDVYQTSLLAGDTLELRAFNTEADLDLYLFDADFELIKFSNAVAGDEYIQINQADHYLIVVEAAVNQTQQPYISKYQLTLAPSLNIEPANHKNQMASFIANEAIVFSPSFNTFSTNKAARTLKPQKRTLNQLKANAIQTLNAGVTATKQLKPSHLKNHKGLNNLQKLKLLTHNKDYASVEANHKVFPFTAYNDPLSPLQWYLSTVKHPQAMHLLASLSQEPVTVAVIDSGLFLEHEDLQGRLVSGFDFVSDETYSCDGDGIDADPSDPGDKQLLGISTFHGTHVAGIIAANTHNAIGIAGIADNVNIMPIRAIGCGDGTTYDLLQAIRFAAGLPNDSGTVPETPADIINLSLGTYSYSASFQALINEITAQGIIVIAAAGNDATNAPAYPASYDNVISVAASNSLNESAPYSNFGNNIDLAAPGGDFRLDINKDGLGDGMVSLVATDSDTNPLSDYRQYQGTSMAAPVVTGGLALLKSINQALTTDDIEALLINEQLTHSPTNTFSQFLGYGILDLEKSLLSQLGSQTSDARLFANQYQFYLNPYQTTSELSLQQTEGEAISVTTILPSEPWLTVSSLNTSARGLGTYELSADHQDLAYGQHQSTLAISASNGQTLSLQIEYIYRQPTETPDQADAGFVYLLLLDPVTQETRFQRSAKLTDGSYQFALEGITAGDYLLVAGTDLDNDHQLCTPGELCAGYPDASRLNAVSLTEGNDQVISLVLNTVESSSLTLSKAKSLQASSLIHQ